MEEEKYIGKVIWFDAAKGYGFISRDNEKDLFVYWSDIETTYDEDGKPKYKTLKKGQEVAFSIGLNNRKQPKAIEVVVISEGSDGEQKT